MSNRIKKGVIVFTSIFIFALATITGAMNFSFSASAAGSDTTTAEYGETLADQTPDSITSKAWAWTPSSTTGWSWIDSTSDFFGNAGSQTFIVKKGSGSTIAYNAITFNVRPRVVTPTVRVDDTGSAAPTSWAGNSNKARTTDSTYKMTITGSTNSSTMGTVTGGGTYWKGQPVTLTATPKSGYKFKQWSTGSTSPSITVTPYSNTTYTAAFEADAMKVTSSFPSKVGDVSIMTLQEVQVALGGSATSSGTSYDPSNGYNTSTYYAYAIKGITNSTTSNLKAVGLSWYQQLNKPTSSSQTFSSNGKTVFGGPFKEVHRYSDGTYYFLWYYSDGTWRTGDSHDDSYWGCYGSYSTYIAVVRAR